MLTMADLLVVSYLSPPYLFSDYGEGNPLVDTPGNIT